MAHSIHILLFMNLVAVVVSIVVMMRLSSSVLMQTDKTTNRHQINGLFHKNLSWLVITFEFVLPLVYCLGAICTCKIK